MCASNSIRASIGSIALAAACAAYPLAWGADAASTSAPPSGSAPLSASAPPSATTAPPARVDLRVNVFPGASNVPLFVGIDQSIFAKYGLTVHVLNTPNSEAQRSGLAEGAFEIAQSAVDNAVAMVEVAKEDVVIVAGGDGSMNELVVRPEIGSISDIRGKILVVDAPNTAFALVARKILKSRGLIDGVDYKMDPVGGTPLRVKAMTERADCAAAMLNPPWLFTAESRGLKSLGRQIDLLGPYQSGGVFVMRKWAQANGDLLERYITALIEATRKAMDPANRALVVSLIVTYLKVDRALAERTYDALMVPHSGLAANAQFDLDGFRAVLALRAEMEGQWGGKPPLPEKYVDLSYYERALKRLGR
jgi:ABC-type nitrate/sulfonate/bicarbonate transport system substrate-binding protein